MSRSRSAAAARLHDSAPIFAALGDETRLQIVARLCAEGPLSITRLSEGAGVTRQAITKHLNALSSAGLARNVRTGREQIWELETRQLEMARRCLDHISDQWDVALASIEGASSSAEERLRPPEGGHYADLLKELAAAQLGERELRIAVRGCARAAADPHPLVWTEALSHGSVSTRSKTDSPVAGRPQGPQAPAQSLQAARAVAPYRRPPRDRESSGCRIPRQRCSRRACPRAEQPQRADEVLASTPAA